MPDISGYPDMYAYEHGYPASPGLRGVQGAYAEYAHAYRHGDMNGDAELRFMYEHQSQLNDESGLRFMYANLGQMDGDSDVSDMHAYAHTQRGHAYHGQMNQDADLEFACADQGQMDHAYVHTEHVNGRWRGAKGTLLGVQSVLWDDDGVALDHVYTNEVVKSRE